MKKSDRWTGISDAVCAVSSVWRKSSSVESLSLALLIPHLPTSIQTEVKAFFCFCKNVLRWDRNAFH